MEYEAEKQSRSLSPLAQEQVDPTAKSAAGWRGKRYVQVCPTLSGLGQKQLAQRSQRGQVAWTAEGTSGGSNCKTQGLAGYARHALRRVRRSPAQSRSSWFNALSGARWLGRQSLFRRARRPGKGLERGPSAGSCSRFAKGPQPWVFGRACCTRRAIHVVLTGLLSRHALRLVVCCTRRSISIDEPLEVGH